MKKLKFLILATLIIVVGTANANKAEAAVTKIFEEDYLENVTKKSADITGDGRKDTIQVEVTHDQNDAIKAASIFINDKKAISFRKICAYTIRIDRITLKSGKKLLYIEMPGDNDVRVVSALYRYDSASKKLKKVGALLSQANMWGKGGFHYYVSSIKTSGNNIVIAYNGQTYACGYIKWKYTYKYSNGKIKIKNPTAKTEGRYYGKKYKASKSFDVYKNTNLKSKAFSVRKGAKVKLKKICYKHKKYYLQFSYKGKTGWIYAGKSDIFYGVILAG